MVRYLSALPVAAFLLSPAHAEQAAQPRGMIDAWHAQYVSVAGETALQPTLAECEEDAVETRCKFDVGMKGAVLSVVVPSEMDEMSFRFVALVPSAGSPSDVPALAPEALRLSAPIALDLLGWDESEHSATLPEMQVAIADSLARLDSLGPDNADIDDDLTYAYISGDHKALGAAYRSTSYGLKISADGPWLYDEALADARTKEKLLQAATKLKATSEATLKAMGEE